MRFPCQVIDSHDCNDILFLIFIFQSWFILWSTEPWNNASILWPMMISWDKWIKPCFPTICRTYRWICDNRTMLSGIHLEAFMILLGHPFRAITLTLAFCERADQSDCNSATHTKHAHTHTSMSRPWYVRHASTTPENDLHPFSGLSFPQWRSPSGLQNL